MTKTYIIRAADANAQHPLGGKARALAELRHRDLPIPEWFVVRPEAFHESLSPQLHEALTSTTDGAAIHALLYDLRPAPAVAAELQLALAELCSEGSLVAVRSSASDEDGAQHSFAGQLDSFLFVTPHEVAEKVAAVWRSGFSERILAYRREHDLPPLPKPPAVLVQRMVNADASGVAFGADPVTGRRGVAVVSALYGLGTALVSGECDADTYHVDRRGQILQRSIADKRTAHRPAPGSSEGVEPIAVPDDRARLPALDDAQIIAVAELVRRTGEHFGRPQDIEWAIERGELFLLQSRPITSLANVADPDGVLNLWDNSNIAESYNGVTTPLTFSFARRAYEEVYRQFCKILRVAPELLDRHDEIFRHMLGLIRGQIYYNLLSWYRLLTLLPGFKANRRFMEQMMGVKEPLPDDLIAELTGSTWRERWRDRFRFFGSVVAMIRNHFALDRQIRDFYKRLDAALGTNQADRERRGPDTIALDPEMRSPRNPTRVALEAYRPDELVAHYRDLERQLLTRWDAPLVNDFFAMIFYGVLGGLTRKWCGDNEGSLQNDLLCYEGGMISAEPAVRVRNMAIIAHVNPALMAALNGGSFEAIKREMNLVPVFREHFDNYLEKFGDRCLEELKLESSTLYDEPLTLLRSIGQFASGFGKPAKPTQQPAGEEISPSSPNLRRLAEDRVRATLGFNPLRRLLFAWVLRNARARVRDRENLRFERTRLFGRVRLIFVELGKRFHAVDQLDHPRDIFYLEVNEALGFVDGTTSTANIKGLVAVRKAEFESYRQTERPADRFETRGVVHQGNAFQGKSVPAEEVTGESRKGLGCCPGIVRGPVRVITDPRNATLNTGDILVAERTDPGWIMLFPSAAGLLVERGSLLSHSAIVAREMGIPAIVSIAGVTRWLHDGDIVELDGKSGIVSRIELAAKAADHEK